MIEKMSFQQGWDEFVRAAGPDKVGDAEWFAARFRAGEVMYLNLISADEARINRVLALGNPPMGLTWADWDGVSARYWAVRLLSDEEKAEKAKYETIAAKEMAKAATTQVVWVDGQSSATLRIGEKEWQIRVTAEGNVPIGITRSCDIAGYSEVTSLGGLDFESSGLPSWAKVKESTSVGELAEAIKAKAEHWARNCISDGWYFYFRNQEALEAELPILEELLKKI